MRKKMVGLMFASLVILAGCTNGQSVPKVTYPVTASETTACHDFSEAFFKNAATRQFSRFEAWPTSSRTRRVPPFKMRELPSMMTSPRATVRR